MLSGKKSVVILARYSLAIEEGVNGARVVAWKTASDWSTPKVAYVDDFFRRKQGIHFSRSILTYCSLWLKSHPKRMGLFFVVSSAVIFLKSWIFTTQSGAGFLNKQEFYTATVT